MPKLTITFDAATAELDLPADVGEALEAWRLATARLDEDGAPLFASGAEVLLEPVKRFLGGVLTEQPPAAIRTAQETLETEQRRLLGPLRRTEARRPEPAFTRLERDRF